MKLLVFLVVSVAVLFCESLAVFKNDPLIDQLKRIMERFPDTHLDKRRTCSNEGETIPTPGEPCKNCYCAGGKVRCDTIYCDWIPRQCVDAEPVDGECCVDHRCPNGFNCWHKGELIEKGVQVEEDAPDAGPGCKRYCVCPDPWQSGGYNDHTEAICTEIPYCPLENNRLHK